MSQWKIDIAAPNGLTGQLVVEDSANIEAAFAQFIEQCRANDVQPDDPEKMPGPAALQPRKKP